MIAKRILVFSVFAGVLSIAHFNCAQDQFIAGEPFSADVSGVRDLASTDSEVINVNKTGYALLTAQQVFKSMLMVTGQSAASTAQMNSYNQNSRVLAKGQNIELINGPMLISNTSLASSVCDGLLNQERALAAGSRKFFKEIDFARGPASVTSDQFLAATDGMAKVFWGREQSQGEAQAFEDFRREFMATLNATEVNAGTATRNMLLGTCSAMLSSFDFITY